MIDQIKTWLARRRIYRQTYKELNSLSNYELNDLGLSRSAVEQIALEAAYGKESRYV